MRQFLYDITIRYTRWTILTWTILFLFDVLLSKFAGFSFNFFGTILGFGLGIFMSTILMNQTQWPLFWRRTSETIQQFWLGIFAVLLFNLILNGMSYLIFQTFRGPSANADIFQSTPLDILWIVIIAFTLGPLMLFDQKALQAKNTLKPARQFLLLLGVYAWMISVVPLFVYSRLLGYTFIEISLVATFLLNNIFILGSIRRQIRIRALAITTTVILFLMVFCYKLEITKSPEPSIFLGKIGPKKIWSFSDLEKVDKPSVWVAWVNTWLSTATDINPEHLNQALVKLESICLSQPTDYPAVIECSEKNVDAIDTIIYGKADETIILARLKSANLFVKLLGVLSARQLEYFSPEIEGQLKEISKSAGRLSMVAEKTLVDHKKDNKIGLRIYVRKKS